MLGIDVNGDSETRWLLFHLCERGDFATLQSHLKKCTHPAYDYYLGTALTSAAERGYNAIVAHLLDEYGDRIKDKGTALWVAAKKGHWFTVDVLLKKCGSQIDTACKVLAVVHAIEQDHESLAMSVYSRYAHEIPEHLKIWILETASSKPATSIANDLLEIEKQISDSISHLTLAFDLARLGRKRRIDEKVQDTQQPDKYTLEEGKYGVC